MNEREKLEKEISDLIDRQESTGITAQDRRRLEKLQDHWYQCHDPDRRQSIYPFER